ncbi:MAG: polysaccharide biosynthesis protein [Desulfobacterota bacterium]|jgi:FlaA1/EpsC-like NDP-sugar epimerase|nr:polysaccharide biosynthesis protein [Thermodesulfobacteriota bacterium]
MNSVDRVLRAVLRRDASLFREDLESCGPALKDQIRGCRVLVIGAAGSIGSAFVKQLVGYAPGSLHLVDISENNLVEVVRDLRSSPVVLPEDFRTFAVAMGSAEFDRLLGSQGPYEYVVNFSALKHVRSEKDPFSLMRMYNTNVFYVKRLLSSLAGAGIRKHFSVSSDKAANPANIMGATKIFMERILLSHSVRIPFSTARFANVAFSDGSLLHGFVQRLAKRQPLAAPNDVKRYFISHEEAGQLCLLACFLGENRDVFFPKLDEKEDVMTFSEIAGIFLELMGYEAVPCASEEEAKRMAAEMPADSKKWPCYFFESDTTGEKPFEEFYTDADTVDWKRYRNIGVISQPLWTDQLRIDQALAAFERIKRMERWRKEDMVEAIRIIVPELDHEEKGRNLDQKM